MTEHEYYLDFKSWPIWLGYRRVHRIVETRVDIRRTVNGDKIVHMHLVEVVEEI